jgi:CRISPR-associated protein Cas5t
VAAALDLPDSVSRFGALCLGESTHLVDVVRRWDPHRDPNQGEALLPSEAGSLSLPVWVDHVGSAGTSWQRYDLSSVNQLPAGLGEWTTIAPPSRN